jgi:hypothetical protein
MKEIDIKETERNRDRRDIKVMGSKQIVLC